MTRHIAETFIDEVIIYDAEKIEIRFLFDDLIAEMTEKNRERRKGGCGNMTVGNFIKKGIMPLLQLGILHKGWSVHI